MAASSAVSRAAPPASTPASKPASTSERLAGVRDLLLVVLVVGVPFLLATGRKVEALGLILLVVLGGWWITRRRGEHLLGPHFYFDLVRLARHKGLIRVRMLYALVLLAGLCLLYGREFGRMDPWAMLFAPGPGFEPNALPQFAESFTYTFFMLQLAAVLVLTPAYVGPAITEEREKRGLELLRTSPVSDREIVVGKLMSRLVHLAGILLTGLPILSLVQFFGGIDMELLLSGFVVTGLTLLSVGGVTILVSSVCQSSSAAVVVSYAVTLCLMTCLVGVLFPLSPFTVAGAWSNTADRWGGVAVFAVVHGMIGIFAIFWAIVQLRMERGTEGGGSQPVPRMQAPRREPALNDLAVAHAVRLPPVGHNPLLWKETYLGAGLGPAEMAEGAVVAALFVWPMVFALCLRFLTTPGDTRDSGTIEGIVTIVQVTVVGFGLFLWLGVGFRAARSVVTERQRQTLDGLLTLPVGRAEILTAKWWGSIKRMQGPAWVLGLSLGLCALLGGFHPLSSLLVAVAVSVHVAFVASAGLALSVLAPTRVRAYCLLALLLFALVIVPLMLTGSEAGLDWDRATGTIPSQPSESAWWFCTWLDFNPLYAWWTLGFSSRDLQAGIDWWRVLGVLQSLAVYALAAILCWIVARFRFEREGCA